MAALETDPKNAERHYSLGSAYARTKDFPAATAQFRVALQIKPDHAAAANDLAWILATETNGAVRNVTEAVRWGKRACELTTNQIAGYLDTLGVAYSEAGRFKEAVEVTERAVASAMASGDGAMARRIESRLELYRAGRAYHEVSAREP